MNKLNDETENTKEKLKENTAVMTHLSFLQNIIARMGGNSTSIKAGIAVIYTIFITILIAIQDMRKYWWVGLIISIVGMIMDAYYLAFERMYRKKYNLFVKNLNNGIVKYEEIYNLNPKNTDLKYEVFAVMLETIRSFSVTGFYMLFLVITIIIKFI